MMVLVLWDVKLFSFSISLLSIDCNISLEKCSYYIRQVNGVKLADILLCVCLCVCAHSVQSSTVYCSPRNVFDLCAKLSIFPYGQYIVGIYVSLAF